MAQRIRRNSMEHLQLYDLDKLTSNYQLPPPLPPPREHRHHAFERYQFLCDMTRYQTDPIYAATPMFRTIPTSTHVKYRRQLLGSHIPSKIVTPVSTPSTKSEEPESARADDDRNEEEEQEEESSDEDDNQESDDDGGGDGGGDDINDSSSSKSSDDDDMFDDDDRGIVEQIFNRGKR